MKRDIDSDVGIPKRAEGAPESKAPVVSFSVAERPAPPSTEIGKNQTVVSRNICKVRPIL